MNLYAMEMLVRQRQMEIEEKANNAWMHENAKVLQEPSIASAQKQQAPAHACCPA